MFKGGYKGVRVYGFCSAPVLRFRSDPVHISHMPALSSAQWSAFPMGFHCLFPQFKRLAIACPLLPSLSYPLDHLSVSLTC
jgi:hypothetical protein